MANEIYEQCIKNPNILQHGDSFLSQYLLNTPQFAEESLQLIFNEKCSTRKYICILFKNILLLNWEQIQRKEALTQIILNGLLVEQNIQILEIITALLCEIIRREQCFQIIPYLLQQSNQSPHLLDVLIYFYANLDDRLNQYTDQVLQQLLTMANSAKVFMLVYYTIKSCTFCQETDIDFLHKCLDATFIKWIERFQQVLQLHDVEQSIYVVKTLNLIFTDMPAYSKSIRKAIVPFLQQYLRELSQTPCVFEDLNFYNDFQELDHSLEVLMFYTIQTTLSLPSTQVCTFEIYGALLLMLNIPSKCAHIQQYINEDDPSVKKSILLFFEEQLANRKTKNQAKQYLLQYLYEPQDLEYKYLIIENFVCDLMDQNQMFPLIDQVIGNQNMSLRKLFTATTIYEKTKGNEQYFQQLFQMNYQCLNKELGIVYLFNLGRLSAHALQNKTPVQQQNVSLLNYQLNEEIAHFYFDSVLQLIKLFQNINCDILLQAYQYWITNPHDYMNSTIILEIIDFISKFNWDSVYQLFSQTNGHIWLQVTIILAKYQPQRLQDKIIPLLIQMNNPHNYEFLCKCTMLLKTLLWQNVVDESYKISLLQALNFQLQLHEDVEIEASTEHVHDLLLVVWHKYLNRQTTQELVNSVCNKIIHTQTPSTTQGLCSVLSCMLYDFQLSIPCLEQVLQKWLKYSTVFRGVNQQQIQFNFLYKLSFNPVLDNLHYKDPYIGKLEPIKQKILEFLIQFKKVCTNNIQKTIKLVQDEDEFQDEQDTDTDFEQDIQIEVTPVLQFDIGHLQQFVQYLPKELQMSLQNINK